MFDSALSLFIPKLYLENNSNKGKWLMEETIRNVFYNQNIGIVQTVHFTKSKIANKFYNVYVYFNNWFDNQIAYNFQRRIFEKKKTRIIYDDPLYWEILKNNKSSSWSKKEKTIEKQFQKYLQQQVHQQVQQQVHQEVHQEVHQQVHQEVHQQVQEILAKNILKQSNNYVNYISSSGSSSNDDFPSWATYNEPSIEVSSIKELSKYTEKVKNKYNKNDNYYCWYNA
jgi:membrane-associated HD superfamily phosphohydrolase